MKNVILACILVIATTFAGAQSWNLYVNQGKMDPAPLLPLEFNGEGEVSFNIGNTGSDPLVYDNSNPDNNLSLVITLQNGVPNKNNPLAAIKGTWKGKFNWSYDQATNSFTGTQKNTIQAESKGTLIVEYKVTTNTPMNAAGNGFDIILDVPDYLTGPNHTQDDAVSSYSYTRAYDFGDAPESYGSARHEINLIRDAGSGEYIKFIHLGNKVDQEQDAFPSQKADGDDKDGSDDEDGVDIPDLVQGNTAVIPITVTVMDNSYGILNAWFDWNGDGDFTDAGEKAPGTPMPVYASGTYDLSVTVPAEAAVGRSYARFRVGSNGGPAAHNTWGEAEDYEIFIEEADMIVTLVKTDVQTYGGSDGSVDVSVTGGVPPYSYFWSTGETTEDIDDLSAGTYFVTIRDANINVHTRIVDILQPAGPEINTITLSGKREGGDILLNWETPSETNSEWFVVERSTDGSEFTQIGEKILAAGNSNTKSLYSYIDENVFFEIAKYRIRLLEIEKSERLSNTITEILDNGGEFNASVYPNPAIDMFYVSVDNIGSYEIELMDAQGKVMKTTTLEVMPGGTGVKTMYREDNDTGQYFIRITEKNSAKTKTLKVLLVQ